MESYLVLSRFQHHRRWFKQECCCIWIIEVCESDFRFDWRGVRYNNILHIFRISPLPISFPILTSQQWSKFVSVIIQDVLLVHYLLRFAEFLSIRENNPRFPTDCRKGTNASTECLVTSPGAHYLKIESLIELPQIVRCETHAKSD